MAYAQAHAYAQAAIVLDSMNTAIAGAKPAMPGGKSHILDKTRICKFYMDGRCTKGEACTFAHSPAELQPQPIFYKTRYCPELVRLGACSAGSSCSYAHSRDERRRAVIPLKHAGARGGDAMPTPALDREAQPSPPPQQPPKSQQLQQHQQQRQQQWQQLQQLQPQWEQVHQLPLRFSA